MADDGKILLSDFIDDNIKSEIKAVANEMQALVKVVSELKGQLQQSYDDQKKYVTVQKEVENVTKKIVEVEAKQKVLDTDLSREYEKKRQAHQKASKEQKDNIAAETSAYKKLSVEYGKALQKARDLAAQYGVNSAEAREATATAKGLNDQLKAIENSMGNHQRNVGNYASALEGATLSVGEMKRALRELRNIPLAGKTPEEIAQVEKQIAMLTDEIGDYQARMRSSGDSTQVMIEGLQGVVAVAQGVTGALSAMGFNTEKLDKAMVQLIGVSQALATIHELNEKQVIKNNIILIKETYTKVANAVATKGLAMATTGATVATRAFGNAIKSVPFVAIAAAVVALVAGVIALAKHLTEASTASKIMTDATEKASQSIGEQRGELQKYLIIARDTNRSYAERQAAIDEINKISPEYLGNINLENINTRAATDALNQYNAAIGRKARLVALQNILVEKYTELEKEKDLQNRIAIEKEIEETEKLIQKQIDLADGKLFNEINMQGGEGEFEGKEMVDFLTGNIWVYHNGKWVLKSELPKGKNGGSGESSTSTEKTAQDELAESINAVNEQYKLRIELAKNETVPKQQLLNLMDAEIEKADGIYRAYEEYYKADKFYSASDLAALRRIDAKTQALKKQRDELEKLTTTETISKTGVGIEGFTPRNETVVTPAGEPTFLDKLGSFSNELDVFWEKYKEDVTKAYTSIGEVISNTFERQSMYLDQQQKETDSYYDNLISNYKDDEDAVRQYTAAKERADEDYDTKRRAIAIRQARFEKAQALLSIAIDTSKAIMKAWAESPKTAILESAIIAGVAAAQTAAVLSRPIPQYASGIESTPRTENALVGERGKEAIIYPDGSVGIANKPTIAMLPRGTEVKNAVDTEKMLQKLSFAAMLPKIMGTEKQEANYTTMLKDIHKTLKVGKHTVNNGMSAKDIYYYKHYNV